MAAYYPGGASPLSVPHFVKARSAERLTRVMMENNLKFKGYCTYTNIQFANGYWYAWFIVDVEEALKVGVFNGTV